MNPKVIVLILSYNGKHLLEDSVLSYLANDYENFEVAVIDNGSTDNTKKYVETNWGNVKVLRTNNNLKYSGGLNFGMKYAFDKEKTDYVLITNNDVKVDEKIISACVNTAQENKNVGFVVGKVYYYDKPCTFQTCGREYDEKLLRGNTIGFNEKDEGQHNNIREIPWCDDIFWLINKKLYEKTGGYNTEFDFQAEDFEWQIRAKKAGFKIYYTPYAKLWHKDSMTIGKKSAFKSYYDNRNPLIAHFMHRNYSEYKYYYKKKRNALFILTFKNLLKLKIIFIIKSWSGFFSALRWGLSHKKITFVEIFM